jgi:thioredoxin-like negative regulator of GroEL
VIERLLAAERALEAGELDKADRLFGQVADADGRNAIAVVGLAEVAHRRGRRGEASELIERALAIDPDDAAAERLRAVLSAAARPGEAAASVAEGAAPGADSAAAPRRSFLERLRAWFRRGP